MCWLVFAALLYMKGMMNSGNGKQRAIRLCKKRIKTPWHCQRENTSLKTQSSKIQYHGNINIIHPEHWGEVSNFVGVEFAVSWSELNKYKMFRILGPILPLHFTIELQKACPVVCCTPFSATLKKDRPAPNIYIYSSGITVTRSLNDSYAVSRIHLKRFDYLHFSAGVIRSNT